MGKIYERFKELKKQYPRNWFMDKVGLVKFENENKKYEIYFTRKRANKYSIIHCKIELEEPFQKTCVVHPVFLNSELDQSTNVPRISKNKNILERTDKNELLLSAFYLTNQQSTNHLLPNKTLL